jgi:Family of unknown function (DUF6492)
MSDIALLTPSYRADLERCIYLFETIDKYLTGFTTHYVIVHDEDYDAFAPYAHAKRKIMRTSEFLPASFWRIPPALCPKGKKNLWGHWRMWPVLGWHVQQYVKLLAVSRLPEQRFCILDSDISFVRPLDMARFAAPNPVELLRVKNDIGVDARRHHIWVRVAHKILGLPAPNFPVDDYIGHFIVWDKAIVQALLAKMGKDWMVRLGRTRQFSEYLLYGIFVAQHPLLAAQHAYVDESVILDYWESERLSAETLNGFVAKLKPSHVGVSISAHSATQFGLIRAGIEAEITTNLP